MAIELLNIDNMEFMAGCRDKQFDLAIVDPPYGINAPNMQMGNNAPSRNGKASVAATLKKARLNQGAGKLKDRVLNKSSIGWDDTIPSPEYFDELRRVSKNQIIWGGNYFGLPATRCVVCWDKVQPWENFSQWEMAWTSFNGPAALFRHGCTGGANSENKIHPTQKPVSLYKFLLRRLAKTGDTILDTHGGSMSIAIAAYDLGFDLTLCELDKDYFTAGQQRLHDHIAKYSPASEINVTSKGELKLF